jgi:membrane-associated protease RseP (regulator of RpoE activity)
MKFRIAFLALAAAAMAAPGAARAQDDDGCPCPGMIGVVFEARRESGDVRGDGVRIMEVRPGSPADEAGVREGDVLVSLNGRDAEDAFDLPRELKAGDTVRMRIRRDGAERDLTMVAARRPATRFGIVRQGPGDRPLVFMNGDSVPLQALTMRIDSLQTRLLDLDSGLIHLQLDSMVQMFSDSAQVFIQRMPNVEFRIDGPDVERMTWNMEPGEDRPFFMELGRRAAAGAELAEMNEGLSRYFGNLRSGALVIEVSPGTPAARAGLEAGDVIVRAAGRDVNDPEDVRRALMRGEDGRVVLEVVRQGRRREITLEWDGRERIIRREIAPTRVRTREPRN